MKKLILITMVILTVATAKATIVDIFVDTDKETYQLDEDVAIFVTAYNPNPNSVTLTFGSSMTVDYSIDDQYIFSDYHGTSLPWIVEETIEPYGSYTQTIYHDHLYQGLDIYPLVPGVHTVVGILPGYGSSAPLEFTVVPEPATLSLLAFGTLIYRRTLS